MRREKFLSFLKNNRVLCAILAGAFAVHCVGITWGLPNYDSWAIDAVVPAGVLKGMAKGFSFGYIYHYPIVHLVLLALLILPVLIVAVVHALCLHTPSQI